MDINEINEKRFIAIFKKMNEISEGNVRIETKLDFIAEETKKIPDHHDRISSLEHVQKFRKGVMGWITNNMIGLVSFVAAVLAWVLNSKLVLTI